jgi:hypothetical protein
MLKIKRLESFALPIENLRSFIGVKLSWVKQFNVMLGTGNQKYNRLKFSFLLISTKSGDLLLGSLSSSTLRK